MTDDMIIRMKRYSAHLVLLALLLSACSSNGEQDSFLLPEPVDFSMEFGNSQTRANTTLDNVWPSQAEVAVYDNTHILKYKTPTYQDPENAPASEASVSLQGVSEKFFWPTDGQSKFFSAWYPYTSTVPELPLTVTVAEDQTTTGIPENSDYYNYDKLYSPAKLFGFRKRVSLKFYHQMCRIVVNVNAIATQGIVNSIALGNGNIKLSGEITTLGETGDGATGTKTVWDNLSGSATIKMRKDTERSSETTRMYTFECILPPQSGGDFETQLLYISGSAYNKTSLSQEAKNYRYSAEYDWKAGYQYNYNMSLTKEGALTVSTVTVKNWGTTDFAYGDADVPDAYYGEE